MDIIAAYPGYDFIDSGYFGFDASEDIIHYSSDELSSNEGRLSLLHEISHALLGHFNFLNDFELLIMETQAWHLTKKLCLKFGVGINDAYIEACIATYDHWLSSRSCCPQCGNFCLPTKQSSVFRCFLCNCAWEASANPHEAVRLTVLSYS